MLWTCNTLELYYFGVLKFGVVRICGGKFGEKLGRGKVKERRGASGT